MTSVTISGGRHATPHGLAAGRSSTVCPRNTWIWAPVAHLINHSAAVPGEEEILPALSLRSDFPRAGGREQLAGVTEQRVFRGESRNKNRERLGLP